MYMMIGLIVSGITVTALILISVNVARIRDKLEMALHMLNELVGRKD